MENVQVEITVQDIELADSLQQSIRRDNLSWPVVGPTPASVALERVTGSKWKTVGALMLMEERTPFRLGLVPATLSPLLEQFVSTGEMELCCFELCFVQIQPRVSCVEPSTTVQSTAVEKLDGSGVKTSNE